MTKLSLKRIFINGFISSSVFFTIFMIIINYKIDKDKWNEDIDTFLQDDAKLIEVIRKKFVEAPSTKGYHLINPHIQDPSQWQAEEVRKLLKNMTKGFFIESGGFDGEYFSNTLFFERYFGWKGILIEPDDSFYRTLQTKNRKCWTAQACLSPIRYPKKFIFQRNGWAGALLNYSRQESQNEYLSVQCLPLYSILLALNVTKIDYFSLDVEGVEFEVLKTIPWDKVNITTISVEMQFLKEKEKELVAYLENLGYSLLTDYIRNYVFARIDYIFYHPKLLPINL